MDPDLLNAALARFADDLTVAGEPAVFDTVVERHLDLLLDLRAAGLRWPGVLNLLKRAGAQRPDGADLSPDQFRASVSRAKRRRAGRSMGPTGAAARKTSSQTGSDRPITPVPSEARHAEASALIQLQATPLTQRLRDHADPDLSEAELDAVRRRLR